MPASRNQIDPVFPLALLQRDCFTGRATCFFPFPSSEPHTHTHTRARARAGRPRRVCSAKKAGKLKLDRTRYAVSPRSVSGFFDAPPNLRSRSTKIAHGFRMIYLIEIIALKMRGCANVVGEIEFIKIVYSIIHRERRGEIDRRNIPRAISVIAVHLAHPANFRAGAITPADNPRFPVEDRVRRGIINAKRAAIDRKIEGVDDFLVRRPAQARCYFSPEITRAPLGFLVVLAADGSARTPLAEINRQAIVSRGGTASLRSRDPGRRDVR